MEKHIVVMANLTKDALIYNTPTEPLVIDYGTVKLSSTYDAYHTAT
jgi:hypothetical protein